MKRLMKLLLLLLFAFRLQSQDTIVLRYASFGKYNVKGSKLSYARLNHKYIVGKDIKGRKRIEGRLNADLFPYLGKKIKYYKNGKIKSIEIYTDKPIDYEKIKVGKWQYFDENGNLIKEINYE